MTTIAQVRTALKQCVETTGLRCSAYVLDKINPPCAQIMRREYDPRFVFADTATTYTFSILVFANRAVETTAAALLDSCGEPSGDKSLIAAIQDGTNWDVTVDYARVINVGDETVVVIADIAYLTIELEVEVVW